MLGVKYFSVAKSLEFPSSGKILTLPGTSGVQSFCHWLSPSFQHCSEGTGSPLVPRGSPRGMMLWGAVRAGNPNQGRPIPSLTHPWASPQRLQSVPRMPVPFSTNLVSPAAISLQRLQPTSSLGVAIFCRENLLSHSFLPLIALEQHQDVIMFSFHMFCEKRPPNVWIFCLETLQSVSDCLSKGPNVSTRELNEILASFLSIRTLLLTSRDSARFLPFTKLEWILEGWKWILICVVSFFPSNSKICYKTRTL